MERLDHVPIHDVDAIATQMTPDGAVMRDTSSSSAAAAAFHHHILLLLLHTVTLLGPLLLLDEGYITNRQDLPISAFCAGDTGNTIIHMSGE